MFFQGKRTFKKHPKEKAITLLNGDKIVISSLIKIML
jgi:hypothetical protein